ncbi:hypothetical protein AB1N83_006553 [Pleurotus pulmonarius]
MDVSASAYLVCLTRSYTCTGTPDHQAFKYRGAFAIVDIITSDISPYLNYRDRGADPSGLLPTLFIVTSVDFPQFQTFITTFDFKRLRLSSIHTIMVWVSNRSSQTLKVTITNTTDGWGDTFEIAPEPLLVETWEQNHWRRKGAENATVVFEKSGLKFETALGPLDVLIVYNDTYIVQSSTKQEWIGTT